MSRTLLLCALLCAAPCVWSAERILNYDINIDVQRDGAVEVTERIVVRAEGSQIRRGIYRDFPTRYRDRHGNRVQVGLEVIEVRRNGEPEPWFTETRANGVRINTGNDEFLPVPAEHEFTIRYRTTRQLGFFDSHDELYWNAIGTGWAFRIDRARVHARLPEPVPLDALNAAAYTGYEGGKGDDYRAELVAPGQARWIVTRPLDPGEGLTIVLTFPKGVVAEPSTAQRGVWLLKDNAGLLVAVVGWVIFIAYCVREWHRVGRDPRPGIVIARYEPPAGFSPAALRYLMRKGYDMRCFSAEVLALAVAGYLRIVREDRLFQDVWRLQRAEATPDANAAPQLELLHTLFATDTELELKQTNATVLQRSRKAHTEALRKLMQPRYFKANGRSVGRAFLIAAATIVPAWYVARDGGQAGVVVIGVLLVLALIVFSVMVRAPTAEGRKLMDEIEGLKLYLSVAERDELARVQPHEVAPQLDAQRYQRLLPYAVALEVENAWTAQFTAAVGVAAAEEATRHISWYSGAKMSDLGDLSRAVGSTLTSQIASSSTPPGSSSGSGGGGSVGGGGGGGGGGGR